jgi:hypothetical protein
VVLHAQVSARRSDDAVVLAVHRQAPPWTAAGLRGLFADRLPDTDSLRGEALALCYAARAAHALHGVATACNHADGGATVALSLPLAVPATA